MDNDQPDSAKQSPEGSGLFASPPTELDYEVIRLIGQGGYGEVWLVRDRSGRHLACKVIYRESFDQERPYEREYEGIKKFEPASRGNESQVNILHVGRRDHAGYFYYLMELADDVETGREIQPEKYVPRTLKTDLARRGRLPTSECLRVGLSLSAALANLHEHGLIHRDIKPANIIFVNGVPKLADIGLVTDADVTVSYVGTEGYIPPEGPGSPSADVYALGKVLYEMCTGRDRLDYPELPTELGEMTEQESLLELSAVVTKACHSNPARRYRTANELHADLTLLTAGKSVRGLRRSERRQKLVLQCATALGAALLAGGALVYAAKHRPGEKTTSGDPLAGAPYSRTPQSGAEMAEVCVRTGFEALAGDDYKRAEELAATAKSAAAASGDSHVVKLAEFFEQETARCRKGFEVVKNQATTLREKPDDPKANMAIGKFMCFVKNDWGVGLPMIAHSYDGAWRGVLEKEASRPGAPMEQAATGDLWWDLGGKFSEAEKPDFQWRARYWYLKALANMSGPDKSELKQRVGERLGSVSCPVGEVHITSRVNQKEVIEIYSNEVRWRSTRGSQNDKINQLLLGNVRAGSSKTIKNTGATRMFPEGVDFLTTKLAIDHKGKRRGRASLELVEDHVTVVLEDPPMGSSELEVTVSFGGR